MMLSLAVAGWLTHLEPTRPEFSLQALVSLRDLDPQERRSVRVLAEVLTKEIEGYSRRDALTVTNGNPIRCSIESDMLRIGFVVPKANLASGLSLMDALLTGSKLPADAIQESAFDPRRTTSFWAAALDPETFKLDRVTSQSVTAVYRRLLDPSRITLAVGGPAVPDDAQQRWAEKVSQWPKPPRPGASLYHEARTFYATNPAGVTTLDFLGKPFSTHSADLPIRLLALVGLGTGKGSSLFRVVRQTLGYSYRQESILSLDGDNFQPRLLMAMTPSDDEPAKTERIRIALAEDVRNWTEADRQRALGMAEAVFLRNVEMSPLAFLRNGPVPDDLEGRTFLDAIWTMKTGKAWNPQSLLDSMRLVPLNELKEAATEIVTAGSVRTLHG